MLGINYWSGLLDLRETIGSTLYLIVLGYCQLNLKEKRAAGSHFPAAQSWRQLLLYRFVQLQKQLLSAETTNAAGTADAERAAVTNDAGATAGDRS